MKKIAIVLSLTILLIGCGKSETEKSDDNLYKRYPVESGIIKYKTTTSGKVMGSVISGKGESSLYFKNYGALELTEDKSIQTTEINLFGKKNKTEEKNHSITKMENGMVYTVDFKNKKIHKMENIGATMLKDVDVNKVGKEMLETMGGKKIANEKFKGYDCEVWELHGSKQYFYKGIPLKSEIKLMGITTITEATSVKFDTKVSDSKFKLPDFEVVDMESLMGGESMNKMMDSDDFQDDMKEAKKSMEKMKNMSFKEWKKLVQENDPEMKQMSDKELKQAYDMMQNMSKMFE
ncbi:MAG: hypothetical protein J7K34_10910 [Flavobacteriaceae bacterium]|nr:hypothetical protein [Flavobacteriaceae bacterium]